MRGIEVVELRAEFEEVGCWPWIDLNLAYERPRLDSSGLGTTALAAVVQGLPREAAGRAGDLA